MLWFSQSQEDPDRFSKFDQLYKNLQQLIAFEKGQKPEFDPTKGVLFVDNSAWYNPVNAVRRKYVGAFKPSCINKICEDALQILKNGERPIRKMIARGDGGKWKEIQQVFNVVRPIHHKGIINKVVIANINKLSDRIYKKGEIWTLFKAAMIAQLILPAQAGVMRNLADGFLGLQETYQHKDTFYTELFVMSQRWVPQMTTAAGSILVSSTRPQARSPKVTPATAVAKKEVSNLPTCSSSPSKRPEDEIAKSPSTPRQRRRVSRQSPSNASPSKPSSSSPIKQVAAPMVAPPQTSSSAAAPTQKESRPIKLVNTNNPPPQPGVSSIKALFERGPSVGMVIGGNVDNMRKLLALNSGNSDGTAPSRLDQQAKERTETRMKELEAERNPPPLSYLRMLSAVREKEVAYEEEPSDFDDDDSFVFVEAPIKPVLTRRSSLTIVPSTHIGGRMLPRSESDSYLRLELDKKFLNLQYDSDATEAEEWSESGSEKDDKD